MATFGQTTLATIGRTPKVSVDGSPEPKTGGITIDWSTVAAVAGSDVTLSDGFVIYVGEKYLRYGQIMTKITASQKYGPYDFAAADGRQTLNKGECYILNETVKENDRASDHAGVAIFGGQIWKDRLIATSGVHSLAAGPTYTELEAVLPRMQYVLQG
jgi:hypothetical protein